MINVHRSHKRLVRDEGRALRPAKTEETVSNRQNNKCLAGGLVYSAAFSFNSRVMRQGVTKTGRETQTDRDRQTDRQPHRETDRQRKRERKRQTERDRDRERKTKLLKPEAIDGPTLRESPAAPPSSDRCLALDVLAA